MSLNKVQLIGRLGKDPETHTFDSGSVKVSFTLATTERWKDRNTGERREKTEWHNIVIMRPGLTTVAQNYLNKGKQIYLEGRIQSRSWDDAATGQKRYMTEIMADNIVMLGGREDNNSGGGNMGGGGYQQPQQQPVQQQNVQAPPPAPISTDMPEDDLPF
ncbi:UNVERIFIED_CONTAM: hypothetical protein GTU68_064905 [Idotea baltica]|nr:hypothetical protein [Idotea baltica]